MGHQVTPEDRLAAAQAKLADAISAIATSEDWQRLLSISRSFHRYSPSNQLLLAAQGAEGAVASFNTWKKVPAADGGTCSVAAGETALRVFAPVKIVQKEIDDETGEELIERSMLRFKLVPVFHQGQLVSPPDFPMQPRLLDSIEPPPHVWSAIAKQIQAAGFVLERGPLQGGEGPKGVTDHSARRVVVRDDLSPAQALKTQVHELAHVMLHDAEQRVGMARDRMEVEAESVAYVVLDTLGVDAGEYSIPYVANWAGADGDLVRSTAQRVLAAAREITARLEGELGVELQPDPIRVIVEQGRADPSKGVRPRQMPSPESPAGEPVHQPIRESDAAERMVAEFAAAVRQPAAVVAGLVSSRLTVGPEPQMAPAVVFALPAPAARGLALLDRWAEHTPTAPAPPVVPLPELEP